MSFRRRLTALVLCVCLCLLLLPGCGKKTGISFKIIGDLDQEEFCVAFRKDDPLCEIMTAAMKELSAEGYISQLSSQYLGTDYSCMPADASALDFVTAEVTAGRKLRIGVQDGVAPLSSSRSDGSFTGLIPDLCQLVAEKLGWTFEYMVINSESVAAELGSGNIDCAWMAASFAESTKSCSLSPGRQRNSHQLVVRADSGINRKNALKGKTVGITDATSMAALKTAELDKKIASLKVGDTVAFGSAALYSSDLICREVTWKVLDASEDAFLIWSDVPLGYYRMGEDNDGSLRWANSEVRRYINSAEFINEYFDPWERAKIRPAHVITCGSEPEWGIDGGEETDDMLFLLDREELGQYCPDEASRGIKDDVYWLRSPDFTAGWFDCVNGSGGVSQNSASHYYGLRVAMWIGK